MKYPWLKLPLSLALFLFGAPAALALESAPVKTPHAEVTLVSEVSAVEPGKPFRLGLRFVLAKGWHIYWVNPGEAGEPPHLDLDLPQGATASDFDWPTPLRIPEGPAMTYSYLGEVLLPLTVTPVASGAPSSFPIKAKASWLICENICVPEEGSFRLDLPAGTASPAPQAPLFAAADARVPRPSPFTAKLSPDATLSLIGEGISSKSVRDAWFFPEKWGAIDDARPQRLAVADGAFSLALTPAKTFDPKASLSGILVVKNESGAESFFTIAATPDGGAAPATLAAPSHAVRQSAGTANSAFAPDADLGVAAMLLFAFLGGLILNLMPCVFPILAIKAVAIAGLSGRERGAVRTQAVSYTLGVLFAFAGLSASLLAFRTAGSFAGWGFQFQSPAFVASMAFVFLLVGLNLSGVFEIGGGFVGAGNQLAGRGGHLGSFFTGLLAVLVATPCTAPFMGAAIAAGLAAPPAATFAVFLAMGLGLAAPFALLGFLPGLGRLLPKPGPWMAILRQALAFPMYAAAAWLVWVISQQSGSDGVLATMTGIVLLGFASWILGVTQGREGRARSFGRAAAGLAALATLIVLYDVATAPSPPDSAVVATTDEKPYSAQRLATLRAEGRPVFVNMTAAWCVTCLVNERIALSSDAVKKAFVDRKVAYLKGDWTRTDPAISDFLREHGRDGVPLYVFFPPKGAEPVVLPQVLTASAVLAELDRFGS
jgi:thiol:disulfide interchange protein/DsbC/DsbD-like thiol-disulfide interchange protein